MKLFLKRLIINILIFESKLILKKYNPSIIAVTGSVGKTSTKDAIFTVLSNTCFIRKSYKSYNSELGIPLTIIGCENGWNDPIIWLKNIFEGLELILFKSKYPECLVLEIGADHPGDIKNIVSWLKTDIVIITKVSDIPVHVEFFKSPEEVFEEKFSLVNSLKENGILIVSADDRRLKSESIKVKQKVLTFSIDNLSTISATEIEFDIKIGVIFKIKYEDNKYPIKLEGVLGNQHIYPIIAAATAGIARNIPILNIIESLKTHIPPRGRMNIIPGLNGSYIIDDTYNSSPDALNEALITLSKLETTGKKIAVIGDMMELGKYSSEEHKKAGDIAIKSSNILITVGPRAKQMSNTAIHFNSVIEAAEYINRIISSEDIVLIKASQSMRIERITKLLMQEPQKVEELLVRQEKEWLNKN